MTTEPTAASTPTAQSGTPDLAAILGAKTKKPVRRWLVRTVVLVLIVGAGVAYFAFGRSDDRLSYTTQPVTHGELTVIVTATGSVEPTENVDISSEQSGTVRDVNVDYNSPVKTGDVLATLDTNKLEADVQSARAKLNSSKANVLKAEAELGSARTSRDRLKSLVLNKVSTQQDLDAAQFSYDSAAATKAINEADVLGAEAALKLAEVNLEKARITSPIDGVVLTRAVDPGATVAASLSAPVLFTIAGDLRRMELQVDVDEADVGQVAIGQTATFTVDAFPNTTFPAEIRTVRFASETVSNVVTYMAVLSVENDKLLLRPGMTATADITVQSIKDTLRIPNAALRYAPAQARSQSRGLLSLFQPPRRRQQAQAPAAKDSSKRTVWVLRNNVPVAVPVETGASDGQFTQLVSGELADGDQLVTDASATSN